MATLVELRATGRLLRYEAELPGRAQEERSIYLFEQVANRIENEIAALESLFGSEINPIEELVAFLDAFCAGEPIIVERQFRPLVHLGDGIWELKTRDVRLFGWFASRDCFICAAIDDATKIKDHNLYKPYAAECVRRREALDLDEPKFLTGDHPNAVLSNFGYPAP